MAALPILRALVDLVAPRLCPGCDVALLDELADEAFCGACAPLIEALSQEAGRPAREAYVFAGPLADAIRKLKYSGRTDLASGITRLWPPIHLEYAGRVDCVIPIPLHTARLRERGFNQSALLAAPLARLLGVPLTTRGLVRCRPTRPQAGLDASQRSRNVRAAFYARPCIKDKRVLVVDDVRTTGATLASAAEALAAHGASEVFSLALARAP